MVSKKDSVFPINTNNVNKGITIRQYYAAMAMQGLISNIQSIENYLNESNITTREEVTKKISEIAFDYSDAMIEAENNGQ